MPDGKELVDTRRLTYKQNAGSALLIERVETGESTTETAFCFNPKYAFVLKKKEKGWLLDHLDFDNPSKLNYGVGKILPLTERLEHSLSLSYPHEIRQKGMRLLKTAVVNDNLRVHYEQTPIGKAPIASKGTMWFDVDKRHALVKVEAESTLKTQRSTSTVELSYDGKLGDFPRLVRRSVKATTVDGDKTTKSESVTDYELRIDDDVPDTEFTLTAFGLPEPRGVEWPRSSRAWLWWGVPGLVLITLGIWLRKRYRAQSAGAGSLAVDRNQS
jgi:hypothetical protein